MLAKLLVDMFERGFNINQLHCVGQYIASVWCGWKNFQNIFFIGHSFGSHMMGIIGRELYANSHGKYKLKR